MVENKSSLFGIIAIIIGASGLGIGAFSVVNFQTVEGPQGLPGDDGQDAPGGLLVGILDPDDGEVVSGSVTIRTLIYGSESYTIQILRNGTEIGTSTPMIWDTTMINDGWWNITVVATDTLTNNQSQDEVMVYIQNVEYSTNVYYCSSQSEIEDALDTIETSHGAIIITKNIMLNSTININNGGNYIIQGAGTVTLNRNASDETFSITNVQSCTIKDLIIDTTNITSSSMQGIYINEGNNNPVYIQNIQIHGGNGRGILVISENVWIQNCVIYDIKIGILLAIGSLYCHILDNSIFAVNPSTGYAYGIYADMAESLTISGNVIYDVAVSAGAEASGISLESSYSSTISNNVVRDISSSSGNAIGIYTNGLFDSISGNVVNEISSISGVAYGMWLFGGASAINGNGVSDIRSSSVDAYGIRFSFISSTITGNVIANVFPLSGYGYGIYGFGNNNVIVGNSLTDCGTISVTGTGNVIDHNTVYP